MFPNIKIFLASKSPRRKQILETADFNVELVEQEVDESIEEVIETSYTAEYLAIKKANYIDISLLENEFLITADTIVIIDGLIYGKPTSPEKAIEMLLGLSNKVHEVITGVCIKSDSRMMHFSESSMVYFDTITPEEATYYVNKYSPMDKAGAYAIQEWIGYCKIKKIEGTFTNIMGLPMNRIYNILKGFLKK
jgi:septum formation protein